MAKPYRRRKSRPKKRRFKRRNGNGNGKMKLYKKPYDGEIKVTLDQYKDAIFDSAGGFANVRIFWGLAGNVDSPNEFYFNFSPEWVLWADRYRYMRINYCKIVFTPILIRSGSTQISYGRIESGTSQENSYIPTLA